MWKPAILATILAATVLSPANAQPAGGGIPAPLADSAPVVSFQVESFSYETVPAGILLPALGNVSSRLTATLDVADDRGVPRTALSTGQSWASAPAPLFSGSIAVDEQLGASVEQPRFSYTLGFTVTNAVLGLDVVSSTSPQFVAVPGRHTYVWEDGGRFEVVVDAASSAVRPLLDPFQVPDAELRVPIPADFFAPGSEPFDGVIRLQGVPLGGNTLVDLGATDTVVRRFGPAVLPDGPPVTVPIEIVALNLRSIQPITVVIDGEDTLWDVQVDLPPRAQDHGQLRIEAGGTFDSTLPVLPRFTFTRGTDVRTLTPEEPHEVTFEDAPWSDACPDDVDPGPLGDGACFAPEPADGTSAGGAKLTIVRPDAPEADPIEVDPSANVDPSAIVGPGSRIGPGAQVGPRALLGPGATLEGGVIVAPDAIVGGNSFIGPNSLIGPGAIVGPNTALDGNAHMGAGAVVGASSLLQPNVRIGDGARLWGSSLVGENTIVAPGLSAPGRVFIFQNAVVESAFLAPNTLVPPNVHFVQDIYTCVFGDGSRRPMPTNGCDVNGGSVLECLGENADIGLPPVSGERTPISGRPPGETGTKLAGDVDASGVAPDNGGETYDKDRYDCDEYAAALETFLQGRGWNATITLYWRRNPDWTPLNKWWTYKWIDGHAITDVHLADGSTVWIEPQWSSGQGAIGIDLDQDGDGRVGYDTAPGDTATEGDLRIEVYDSRSHAEVAGAALD